MEEILGDAGSQIASAYATRTLGERIYAWWSVWGTAVGTIAALMLVAHEGGIGPEFLALVISGTFITGLGVTLGLHRLLSHRSFRARRRLEILLFVLGTAAGQGYPIRWIYDHRIHHRYTDVPGDPHSPFWWGNRRLGLISGFLHAHALWLLRPREPIDGHVVRDLAGDKMLVGLDRAAPLIVVAGLVLPGFIGALIEPTPMGFLKGSLWGGVVRMFLLNHVTWSVNSVCHMLGGKPDGLSNEARNNPVVGILAFGEGWHGNHHLDPSSARHGWQWYQIDVTWGVIRLLESAGLIDSVRRPRSAVADLSRSTRS